MERGRRVVLTPRSEQLCATAGVAPELLRAAALESAVKPGVAGADLAAAPSAGGGRRRWTIAPIVVGDRVLYPMDDPRGPKQRWATKASQRRASPADADAPPLSPPPPPPPCVDEDR